MVPIFLSELNADLFVPPPPISYMPVLRFMKNHEGGGNEELITCRKTPPLLSGAA